MRNAFWDVDVVVDVGSVVGCSSCGDVVSLVAGLISGCCSVEGGAVTVVVGVDTLGSSTTVIGAGDLPPERRRMGRRITARRKITAIATRSLRIGFFSITVHQLEELLVILGCLHLALYELQRRLRIIQFTHHLTQDPHPIQYLLR